MGLFKRLRRGIRNLPSTASKEYELQCSETLLSEQRDGATKKPSKPQRGRGKSKQRKKEHNVLEEDDFVAEGSNGEDRVNSQPLVHISDSEAQREPFQHHKKLVPAQPFRSETESRTVRADVSFSPIIPRKATQITPGPLHLSLDPSFRTSLPAITLHTEQAVIQQQTTTYQDANKGITFRSESSKTMFSRESPATPTQPAVPLEQLTIVRTKHHNCWDAPPQKDQETRCFEEMLLPDQQNSPIAEQTQLRITKRGQYSWFTDDRCRFVEMILPPRPNPINHKCSAGVQGFPIPAPRSINSLQSFVQSSDDGANTDYVEVNGVFESDSQNSIQQLREVTHPDTECTQRGISVSCTSQSQLEGGAGLLGNYVEEGEHSIDNQAENPTPISDEQHYAGLCKPVALDDRLPSPDAVTNDHVNSTPTDGDENRLTEERSLAEVMDKLEVTSKTRPSQKPDDFDELIREIALLVEDFPGMAAPLYCPAPGNYYRVLVQGKGLKKFAETITIKTKRFEGYEVVVSDMEPYRTMRNGLPIYTEPLKKTDVTMPYHLQRNVLRRNPETEINTHVSTVGAFVKDERSRDHKRIYGLTACHALTMEEEEHMIVDSFHSLKTIQGVHRLVCKAVIGRVNLDEHLSIALHNGDSVQLKDSPFIAYTHNIPIDHNFLFPFQKFTCDIALLPVDPESLDDSVLIESPMLSPIQMHPDGINLKEFELPRKQTRIAGRIKIEDKSDIDLLRENNVRLVVGGTRGTLEVQPETLHTGTHSSLAGPARENRANERWMLASHFFFSTEEPLRAGHSGVPVMVYNPSAHELYIIGLLMGKFVADKVWSTDTLYQAMPLSPALKQLEHLYPDHLERLRLVAWEKPNLTAYGSLPLLSQYDSCNKDNPSPRISTTVGDVA